MPHYSSSGLQLFYEDVGTGPPLVLLHGFGTYGRIWADAVSVYQRFFGVLVVGMRGCGRGRAAPRGFTTRDLAGDVVGRLARLGIGAAHFAGWSLGGAVGLELAIGNASRLLSLSLHSSFAGGRPT